MGTHYNGKEKRGYHTSGNDKKVIHTRSGTKIILNDAEGSVFIEDPSGNRYLMDGARNINVNAPKNMTFTAGENTKSQFKIGNQADIIELGVRIFFFSALFLISVINYIYYVFR